MTIGEQKYKEFFYAYKDQVFIYISQKIKDKKIIQNVFINLWDYRSQLLNARPEVIVIFNVCDKEIFKFLQT